MEVNCLPLGENEDEDNKTVIGNQFSIAEGTVEEMLLLGQGEVGCKLRHSPLFSDLSF
jgi:hypothetical protein